MTEGVQDARRRSMSQDLLDLAPPPGPAKPKPLGRADAPWTTNERIGASSYPSEVFSNPALRASWPSNAAKDWPTLPPLPNPGASPSGTPRCSAPIPVVGNARRFADRGIPLGIALQDGAFGTSTDLERYIDEYVAYTARRPEMKQLHAEAMRVGPEILAKRLDAEGAEAQRQLQEQQLQDRVAPLQIRAPLPIQQRIAVGEVAIPIARATVTLGKFVPLAGELIVLSEVATGRTIAGLGEKLDRTERAIDAAVVAAPFALKALGSGVRGAAEILRLSRSTGRSLKDARALCRTAVDVSRNRNALREGVAAAKAGRALSAEQQAAMRAVGKATSEGADAGALRRRMYKQSTTTDASLTAGEGRTDKYGNVTLSPHGSAKDLALARAHESVHSFLSPKALNGLREFRADLRMTAYQKSSLCQYLEEALAESYAQVKVNGLHAFPRGLTFPIREGYVTIAEVAREGAIGTLVYGGILYGVYVAVNRK